MRILIIGSSAAGLGAAEALCARLRARGDTGRILPQTQPRALAREIAAGRWDAVTAVHPRAVRMLRALRRTGQLAVPSLGLAADYQWSPGWVGCDAYALAHPSLIQDALRSGIPARALHATGVPVYGGPGLDRIDARRALGIPRGGWLVLAPNARGEQIDALLDLPDFHPWVAAVCSDEELSARLARRYARQPRVLVRGAQQPLELWLDSCNVLVGSAHPLLLARAAARRTPLVLTGDAPGAALFAECGMALSARTPGAAARAARLLCQNTGRARAMRQAQSTGADPCAAETVCRLLASL